MSSQSQVSVSVISILFSSDSLSLNKVTLFLFEIRAKPLTFNVWKEALQLMPSYSPKSFGSGEVEVAGVAEVTGEEEAEVEEKKEEEQEEKDKEENVEEKRKRRKRLRGRRRRLGREAGREVYK